MVAPAAAFFAVIGRMAYRYASRKAAEALVKRMGKGKVTKTPPKGVQVSSNPPRQPSSQNQPRSADTGKMQSPKPSPATRRGTDARTPPKKPTTPARSDKSPTTVGRPSTPQRGVTTKSPAQPKSGTGRGKAPMMPKSRVTERPNTRPSLRSKAGAAAGLRGATMPSADKAPTADKTTPTRPNNKSGEMPAVKRTKVTPNNKSGEMPKAKKAEVTKSTTTRPKMNPLDGWSDARRKTLRSDKIGKDAGDGMKWVVGSNSNALVRTRDMNRVKENLRLQKLVKQTKDTYKGPDTGGR